MEHRIIDVAKWSTLDIKTRMDDLYIKPHNVESFVNEVVDLLDTSFDASAGINWDIIDECIREIENELLV